PVPAEAEMAGPRATPSGSRVDVSRAGQGEEEGDGGNCRHQAGRRHQLRPVQAVLQESTGLCRLARGVSWSLDTFATCSLHPRKS
ncbi:unnamed protein product, partial [Effrenium voratum]